MNEHNLNKNIFIPTKINVGYQNRTDTYTGKLAYIIPFNENGKLRKEKSWNSWRDKKIPSNILKNESLEGFILNKPVGGYKSNWNYRQSYIRIYDPRNFEFEISLENLLYILTNTTSSPGKALEGNFVYGWDGKDLILIPTNSPDYIALESFNNKIHQKKKIDVKILKLGAIYLNKQNEKVVYLGRYDYYGDRRWHNERELEQDNKGKYYYFSQNLHELDLVVVKSLSNYLIDIIDENCVENYHDLFYQLQNNKNFFPIDKTKNEYVLYTLEEFKERISDYFTKNWGISNGFNCINYNTKLPQTIYRDRLSRNTNSFVLSKQGCVRTYSIEEIYELIKPCYLIEYLTNGNQYGRMKTYYGDI